MAELKKIKLALKIALRRNKQLFEQGRNWESFDTFINLLLSIIEDFGFTKEQVLAIYEEVKREVENEKNEKMKAINLKVSTLKGGIGALKPIRSKRKDLKIVGEEKKFLCYERIRRRGLYNMLMDWQKVLKYAKRYFKIDINEEDYFFIIENYSELKEKYVK